MNRQERKVSKSNCMTGCEWTLRIKWRRVAGLSCLVNVQTKLRMRWMWSSAFQENRFSKRETLREQTDPSLSTPHVDCHPAEISLYRNLLLPPLGILLKALQKTSEKNLPIDASDIYWGARRNISRPEPIYSENRPINRWMYIQFSIHFLDQSLRNYLLDQW